MKDNNVWRKTLVSWLPLGVVIVIFSGLVYAAVQQSYRMSANDPQIQVAEDVSLAVTSGQAPPDSIVPAQPSADMAKSLSTFLAIYNATGTPIGSSVALDGKLPVPPSGVFDSVKLHGEDRFTWQPKPGLRLAAVVVPYSGSQSGFVLVGRSLREVEIREANLEMMAAVAGVAALLITFLLMLYFAKAAAAGDSFEPSASLAGIPAPEYRDEGQEHKEHHGHDHHHHSA